MKRLIDVSILSWLVLAWMASVGAPLVVAHVDAVAHLNTSRQVLADSPVFDAARIPVYLATTCGWGLLVAVTATLIALPVGLAMGGTRSVWVRNGLLAAALTSACLPPYIAYWSIGLLRLPGSWIGDFLASGPVWLADLTGVIQTWLGLSFWVWPLPALLIGAAVRRIPSERLELIELDHTRLLRRKLAVARQALSGVMTGVGVAFLMAINAAIVYDLASTQTSRVQTYSEALRRLFGETWDDRATLLASVPMLVFGLIAAGALLRALREKTTTAINESTERHLKGGGLSWLVPGITLGGPVLIMAISLGSFRPFRELSATDGRVLRDGLILAAVTGAVMGSLTIAASYAWMLGRSRISISGSLRAGTLAWIWMSLIPAVAIGTSLVVTYNRPWLSWIYETPVIVVLGYLARYGFLIVFLSWWIAESDRRTTGNLQLLDGVSAFSDWLQVSGLSVIRVSVAGGMLGAILSFGEISTTVIVTPPGFQSPAERLLNRLHYAREDAAMAFSLLLVAVVAIICIIAAIWLRPLFNPSMNREAGLTNSRKARSTNSTITMLVCCAVLALAGCDREGSPKDSRTTPIEEEKAAAAHRSADPAASSTKDDLLVFGGTGRRDGQFIYPRAMDLDPARDRIYVVDRSGRIQLFDLNGVHVDTWELERYDRGYPTGITVDRPTGRVYLADTHNHRVVVFQPDGAVVRKFGEYGDEPGQFIYPTDVAIGKDGRLYVSEYGGNDRIQIFTNDGEYLSEFGEFGRDDPDEFSRPQSLFFDPTRSELWIADSCNHRIVITDPEGKALRTIGTYGTEPGTYSYPYDVVPMNDGSVLVTEFGNSRIQRISREGETLGLFGTFGEEPGELHCPWSASFADDRLFVLDSKNNRVQVFSADLLESLLGK